MVDAAEKYAEKDFNCYCQVLSYLIKSHSPRWEGGTYG